MLDDNALAIMAFGRSLGDFQARDFPEALIEGSWSRAIYRELSTLFLLVDDV